MTDRAIKVTAGKKPYFRQVNDKRPKSVNIPWTEGRAEEYQ